MSTLLPRPATFVAGAGTFRFGDATAVAAPPALGGVARWLRGALSPPTGLPLAAGPPGPDTVALELADDLPTEGYRLLVRPDRVRITGGGPAGVFHGAQTLRQLLPPQVYRRAFVAGTAWLAPCVEVSDAPRFGWRGAMLDVARHFMPKADVLRLVDLLAVHKLNVLHLHLTDDQGWRLEVRRRPELTRVGAWRRESMLGTARHERFDGRPHGGYYTRDDIREIVAYAAERFVTVVPEIDIPGHSQAAIAAYPELGNTTEPVEVSTRWGISRRVLNVADATIAFYRDVFDEVLDLFPGEYIGIGGDECPKDEWRASPAAQERMRALGLRDEDELQSWFVRQFTEYLIARGRRPYGWDDILEGGLAAGATVASWRGTTGAVTAARAGHDVVLCPDMWTYLDYRQSDRPDEPVPVGTVLGVDDVYAFEPMPAGLTAQERARVLGAQCNIWTEHLPSTRAVDYAAFPRLCAFAERVWATDRDPDFRHRLAAHLTRLDALGVEYRPDGGPLPWQTRPDAPGFPKSRATREAEIAAMTRYT
ncbi:beta-N-acetylhexosaminidase [Virgisporangium aliadipatigenens]|uniref:beta-N-acetylhexosaminidase n=1 Tax=Virgisporangium aliadipatigenens TaxID=741659 RepID=A0A8J3YHS6_9ACTN|nr:beta-N-acetylhexosaminidase [Virgisporangium aliadipatigenens]GIJ45346.1 beta-N-acetylhexosaminidase [Virgisporangium aliadipatigenens]